MFGETSQNVFGAVAFLQEKVVNYQTVALELAFVIGKVRVAPMKALTSQKLELQAAVLVW